MPINYGANNVTTSGILTAASGNFLNLIVGRDNTSSGYVSTVGGGRNNTSSSNTSTIAGGYNNTSSGYYSTVGGGKTNTSSGSYSTVVGGYNNTSSGYGGSTVGGGRNNTSGGANSTVGGGYNNTSSSYSSTVGGGNNNTSSGSYSTVAGGRTNTSSGNYSTVAGGYNNTSSNNYSTIGGGYNNTSSGNGSTVTGGRSADADRFCMEAYSSGGFGSPEIRGSSQKVNFVLRNSTTNNTATTLFLNGSSTRLTIPSGKALFAIVNIAGIINGGSKAVHYVRKVAIKNVGGTTSLIGTISTIGTDVEDDAAYDVSITADNTNDALQIDVTGKTSETIRWTAHVEGVEIKYG